MVKEENDIELIVVGIGREDIVISEGRIISIRFIIRNAYIMLGTWRFMEFGNAGQGSIYRRVLSLG